LNEEKEISSPRNLKNNHGLKNTLTLKHGGSKITSFDEKGHYLKAESSSAPHKEKSFKEDKESFSLRIN
jgi:hypothetical protein